MKKLNANQIEQISGGVLCGPTAVEAAECIVLGCIVPGALQMVSGVLTLNPNNIGFTCTL